MLACQVYDLLPSNKSINSICRDAISVGLRFRSNNISKAFISGKACNSKINTVLMQKLNRALYDECRRNGFTFVDNGAVTENDIWVEGIYLQESRKHIITNNLINNFNHFWNMRIPSGGIYEGKSFMSESERVRQNT